MPLTRRTLLRTMALTATASSLPAFALPEAPQPGWTPEWNAALLDAELRRADHAFDPKEHMTGGHRGPEYNYQSNLRNSPAHSTRDSVDYASLLLYTDDKARHARAADILRRVMALQVTDPNSRYFGLWSWFMEEPVDKMNAADFNWADFIGASLLNILYLHTDRLPPDVVTLCRTALSNAAVCIRKRNVSLSYTNIAFQGTYVTLGTGELLNQPDMLAYAKDRFNRLAALTDQTSSFAEYNSPTYNAVVMENLARILSYVKDPAARTLATRLNALVWKHIAEHWHAPTMQLAGPMSRCYFNNIGSPMFIQKGTNNRVQFISLDQLKQKWPGGEGNTSTIDFHCPEDLIPLFFPTPRHQHREVFVPGNTLIEAITSTERPTPVAPIEGTTLLTPNFCLGSCNRSDFWVQRRPLIAYWGDASRPPRVLQFRVIHDDYDYTSALFYSAQNQGSVLGSVRFRTGGGDKHPSLDRIKDDTITLNNMTLQLLLEQWHPGNRILVNGKPQSGPFTAPWNSRIALDAGPVKILFQTRWARWREEPKSIQFTQNGEDATLNLDLFRSPTPQPQRFADLTLAGIDFTLWMDDSGATLEALDTQFAAQPYHSTQGDTRKQTWSSKEGTLTVQTSAKVEPIQPLDESFTATLNAQPIPQDRLDQAPIHY
jgi:hypothetical protein